MKLFRLYLAALLGFSAFPASADRLESTLELIRKSHKVPGYSLIIVDRSGVTRTLSGGLADIESGRPMNADTLVRIGSITKTFNALAALKAEKQGLWNLDDKLRDIIPDPPFHNPWAETHPVRIGQLIDHTAGFTDLTRAEMAHNQPFPTLKVALEKNRHNRVVRWKPGLFSEYSNTHAGYLGRALEIIHDQPYERLMREKVLHPLGMSSATLKADPKTLKRLATGYDTDGKTMIPYWHMYFEPLGAINATPREMAALPLLMLNRGEIDSHRFLGAKQIARMERPATGLAAQQGLTFGYGLGTDQEIRGGRVWHGHLGDGDGYLSQFAYQRELGVGYFLTINAFNHPALRAMKGAVQKNLVQAAPPARAAGAVSSTDIHQVSGRYRSLTWRFEWRNEPSHLSLESSGNRLFLRYSDSQRLPLLETEPGLFRHPVEPVATMAITEHENAWYLIGEFGAYRRIEP